jgi:hypothetical protein
MPLSAPHSRAGCDSCPKGVPIALTLRRLHRVVSPLLPPLCNYDKVVVVIQVNTTSSTVLAVAAATSVAPAPVNVVPVSAVPAPGSNLIQYHTQAIELLAADEASIRSVNGF